MKNYILVFTVILVIFGGTSFTQVPNDECSGATVITSLPDSFFQDTKLATPNPTDPILPCADGGGGNSVWYVFTADSSGWITISSRGSTPSDYDVALAVFTGSCGSLTMVGCNDDIDQGVIRQAELIMDVDSGITYIIHVAEWYGGGPSGGVPTGGDLELRVYWSAPPPPQQPIVLGPKSGTVSSGVAVSTDNFPFKSLAAREPKERKHEVGGINERPTFLNPPKNLMPPTGPEGSNYKEDGIKRLQGIDIETAPLIFKDFEGIDFTGVIPPDPIIGVGPDHLVVMVNSTFKIYDKSGNLLKEIDYSDWWATSYSNAGGGDPQVIYDHFNDRWVMLCDDFDHGIILLSVSDDGSPLGTWYNYALQQNVVGDSLISLDLTDHPWLGFDDQAIYIMTREICTDDFFNRLRIIPNTQLYSNTGGTLTFTDFYDFRDPDYRTIRCDFIKPALMYGTPNKFFLINAGPFRYNTYLTVWTISDPVTSPSVTVKNIPVVAYRPALNAPQPGGGVALENLNGIISFCPVYRDGLLWATHTIRNPVDTNYTAVRYVKIDPYSETTEEDAAMGQIGYWYLYSAIGVAANHDVVVTYSRSSLSEYVGAYISGRRAADSPGLVNGIPLKAGSSHYELIASGRNRWGDYMGAYIDPVDTTAVWVHTEFAKPPGYWSTWVGKIKMGPLPGAFINADNRLLSFPEAEVGHPTDTLSFTIVNNGLDDLVISDITPPDSHLTILNMPTLPLTLATFETYTIDAVCIPVHAGNFSGEIIISSNDANNPSYPIDFAGNGYLIYPIVSNMIYASSGSEGYGGIFTVDNFTGQGTQVGLSGFSQVTSIKVNPATRELFGLVPVSSSTMIVRINSTGGDAHFVSEIPLSNLKGMAFKEGTLYVGRLNGSLYSVDVESGIPTLIANTGIPIAGLDVNPLTGELWASIRSTLNSDRIYKISLPTGEKTLIGQTGLGTQIQDISFDAGGNLFGLSGTGSNVANFILIDTLTGTGSVQGSTNIIAGQALAIDPEATFPIFTYRLDPQWQLVSIPVQTAGESKSSFFPTANSDAFTYTSGYSKTDSLMVGKGYWLRFDAPAVKMVSSVPLMSDTLDVQSQWNLLGSISVPVPVGEIVSIPGEIFSSVFLSYEDGGYVIADSLKPGKGYWNRVSSEGQLILGSAVPNLEKRVIARGTELLKGFSELTIKDTRGNRQTLYIGAKPHGDFSLVMFEMPPVPPVDEFSARFKSGRMLETHPEKFEAPLEYPLIISSGASSINLLWSVNADHGVKYILVMADQKSSKTREFLLDGEGSMNIGRDAFNRLAIRVDQSVLPIEYALGQNYPNPFNPITRIIYQLPEPSKVTIKVYNMLGQAVAVLIDKEETAGIKATEWNASDLASGIYFYRMEAVSIVNPGKSFKSVEKMILIR